MQVFSILKDKAQQQKNSMTTEENSSESVPFEYSIEVGMMEIYNDEGGWPKLKLRMFFSDIFKPSYHLLSNFNCVINLSV